jgi:hypothetical protein
VASVIINGFLNDAEAIEFISWFEGQGEQDLPIWFEERRINGFDVRDSITTDCATTYPLKQDANGNWILNVQ